MRNSWSLLGSAWKSHLIVGRSGVWGSCWTCWCRWIGVALYNRGPEINRLSPYQVGSRSHHKWSLCRSRCIWRRLPGSFSRWLGLSWRRWRSSPWYWGPIWGPRWSQSSWSIWEFTQSLCRWCRGREHPQLGLQWRRWLARPGKISTSRAWSTYTSRSRIFWPHLALQPSLSAWRATHLSWRSPSWSLGGFSYISE